MADTPYNEPAEIRAGDTSTWIKQVDDYPATDGWTLYYSFRNATQKINVTAAASGADYLVTITRNTSKTWTAGRYDWACYVAKGTSPNDEQHTIDSGSVQVLPDLSADTVIDLRSDARKIYDDLLTAYKAYVTGGKGHIEDFTINGTRFTFRTVDDILKQIKYWAAQVAAEEDVERMANGEPTRNVLRALL